MLRAALLFSLALAGCGRDAGSAADSGAAEPVAAASSAAADASPGARQAPCPATGLWSPCAAIERLDRSGLAPRVDSSEAREPPLTVAGTLVHVGRFELELYFYPDAAAAERAAAALDRDAYVSYDAAQSIHAEPTLITSANMIAIHHSTSSQQRERVGLAITAGPPQPVRP